MATTILKACLAVFAAPLLIFGTMIMAAIVPAVAQLDQAKSNELQNTQEGATAQAAIDRLDNERDGLEIEYRETLEQLDNLRQYNEQLRGLVQAQEDEKASIREQIERITGIEREIVPLMFQMLETLEQFVELDVPFLVDERRRRAANLRALMTRADATNAEKYRRILEAYQIENDYGRTIEAYEGKIGDGEDARTVTFLKIGRVAFMYQTLDGSASFVWNQAAKQWEALPASYNTQLTVAIRMAREQIPPDLIFIPVTGPAAAQ